MNCPSEAAPLVPFLIWLLVMIFPSAALIVCYLDHEFHKKIGYATMIYGASGFVVAIPILIYFKFYS